MRRLPPLHRGNHTVHLPMADASALALAEALLGGPSAAATTLAPALALDPGLAIWTVARAWHDERLALATLDTAADWLARRLVDVLRWTDSADLALPSISAAEAGPFTDRVAAGIELSESAAALCAAEGTPGAAEEARLGGLLHHAPEWLALGCSGVDPAEQAAAAEVAQGFLPADPLSPPAARALAVALRLRESTTEAESTGIDLAGIRRRAAEGRARWLEAEPAMAAHLPALAARLARLAALETHFQDVLEEEKLAALAEFAAGAGHEINNPLAIIGGRAQLLLRDEPDAERRHELAVIHAQVRRAHEMIADMRLFARPPEPAAEKLDLAALVDALVAELAPLVVEQGISLARGGEPGPLEIEADPAQLQVALRALVKNAQEAIGHDGRIEIALRGGDEVAIDVTDDGPGILPEQRRHLFDPFFSARQAGRGLGLGLSKCWRIAQMHGGRITVESQPGQGARFTLTLPRAAANT